MRLEKFRTQEQHRKNLRYSKLFLTMICKTIRCSCKENECTSEIAYNNMKHKQILFFILFSGIIAKFLNMLEYGFKN